MKTIVYILFIVTVVSLSGCALLDAILGGGVKEPVVKIESVDFGSVSFESLELLFNIMIENPNQFGISLSSFDYELLLNERSFVKGDQRDGMQIAASAKSAVQIPVSLRFRDIIESVQSVAQQDTSKYQFKSGFAFSVPVIGDVRIPVQRSGMIPVVKAPSINIAHLKIDNLSFTGARATLALDIKNPNSFSLGLKNMQYAFSVDGTSLIEGTRDSMLSINKNEESRMEIPFTVNFLNLGQSIYRVLRGEQTAQFRLTGSAAFDSSLDFFQNIPLNFDTSGELPLVR
jgi:LEA14-like dessication related protein